MSYDQSQSDYVKSMIRRERLAAAKFGWFNWYVNRGRLPLNPSKKELRALSWRRVR